MHKAERIQKIKEIIFEQKQIDVAALSSLLNVTDATIRSDLEKLEEDGYLTRFHGGASLNPTAPDEEIHTLFPGKFIEYDKSKEEIGILCSNLIQEKEWVFLGPGVTSYYIAKALANRSNINVLTNNLLAANTLSGSYSIQVMFLGGRLNSAGLYTIPKDITKELHHIYLNKAFFSVDAVDFESGYTLSDLNVLEIIKAISVKCQETVFAIEHRKFGQRTFMRLGGLDFAQTVAADSNIPPEYKKFYLEHGVSVYTPQDIQRRT